MKTAEPPKPEALPERPEAALHRIDVATLPALEAEAWTTLLGTYRKYGYITDTLVKWTIIDLWYQRQAACQEQGETSGNPVATEEDQAHSATWAA